MNRGALCGLLLVALASVPASASADVGSAPVEPLRAAARSFGYAGARAHQEGRFGDATQYFERAYRLMPVPTLGLGWARSLMSLGKLVAAHERLLEITRTRLTPRAAAADRLDYEVQRQAQRDAERECILLEARIPTLQLLADGIDADEIAVSMDGSPVLPPIPGVGWRLDPGRHRIVATHGAHRSVLEVALAESEHQVVPVTFAAQNQSWTPMQWAGVAAAGTGLVALGAGGALLAVGGDGGNTHDDLGLAFGMAGGVLAVSGLTLFLKGGAATSDQPPVNVALSLGPSSVGARIQGSF